MVSQTSGPSCTFLPPAMALPSRVNWTQRGRKISTPPIVTVMSSRYSPGSMGTHQVDHRPTHQCLDRALLKQPHPAVRNRVRLAAQGCERRVASPLRRGRPAGLFWRLCPYHFNGAVGDRCANRTDRRQHGCDQHADDADSQGNLQHGVALVFDADATDVAFVKQLFHGREQLLTHHLEFFAIFWWLSGRRGKWICLCHGCSPISRVLRCGFDLDLGALDTWLVRSRLTVSCCSDGFRGLAARTLCPLLDAQHTFAHHRDVGELHKQAKQDRRPEPAVMHAHARNQACLAVILWVKPPVPGSLTFLIPPEHPLIRFKGLDPHALFSIWTERYHVADCHLLELGEDALGTGLAKIIQPIVAVPASSCDDNLHRPGPDLLRSRLDGASPCGVKRGMLDHFIAGHGAPNLFVGRPPPQLPGTDEAQVHSQQNDSKGC